MSRILIQTCCIAVLFTSIANSQESLDKSDKENKKPVPARIPTGIALRNAPYQGHEVVVLRRPLSDGGDVIVLSGAAVNAKRLAAAAVFLTALRENLGDETVKVSMIPVPYTPGADAMAVDIRAAGRSLEKLRTAPHQDVRRIGSVQMTTIYLPSQAGRDALKKRGIVDFSRGRGGRGAPAL